MYQHAVAEAAEVKFCGVGVSGSPPWGSGGDYQGRILGLENHRCLGHGHMLQDSTCDPLQGHETKLHQ